MGLINWALAAFNKDTRTLKLKDVYQVASIEVWYKRLAIETCIDLIANTISRCEIQTFQKGKAVRQNNYYLLNVQPNQNHNATEFMHKAISKYLYESECLIVMHNKELFVADSFGIEEFTLKPNLYKDVTSGGYTFSDVFTEKDVIHLKLKDRNIIKVIDGLYESYGKLLASGMNYYRRKNNKRLLIKGDFLRAQDDETQKEMDQMFESQLKNWFDPEKEGGAFNLQDGYEFEDMSDSVGGNNNSDSRDISNIIDDIINYVAMAFHAPRGLVKGDIADIEKQVDAFLMFTINPIAEIFADEFNRKMYSKDDYLERTYLKVDTSKVKIIDIGSLAAALDKLFAIGGVTTNEVLEALGKEPTSDPIHDERHVTKNYQKATDETSKGGEK